MKVVKNFKEFPDYYIGLSKAALMLGYKDYRKVSQLIEEGHLTGYHLPANSKIKVKYHELMKVPSISKL